MKYFLILSILCWNSIHAQPPTDTLEKKFRARIKTFVNQEAEALLKLAQTNLETYDEVFGPCDGKDKQAQEEVRQIFINKLAVRLQAIVTSIYKEGQSKKHFGAKKQSQVEAAVKAELKDTRKNYGKILDKICSTGTRPLPPNAPPVANAGPDQVIRLPKNSVLFYGSASDPHKYSFTFGWTKLSGPDGGQLDAPGNLITTAGNLREGDYFYLLRVTNQYGLSAWDTVKVTVLKAYQRPEANAGPDQDITLPVNSVILNGKGSQPDTTGTQFSWSGIKGRIVSPKSAITAIEDLEAGIYQFFLTVAINDLLDSDTVLITVRPAPPVPVNRPPVADAGADITIIYPEDKVVLEGKGSDPDEDPVTFNWKQLTGPAAAMATPAFPTTIVGNLSPGQYQFILTVTDNKGAIANDSVIVTVTPDTTTVKPVPLTPTANAGPDQDTRLTTPVTLKGSGSDPDGRIVSYQWSLKKGDGKYHIAAPGQATTIIDSLQAGEYIFELTVTDNEGNQGTDEVIINVKAKPILSWFWIIIILLLLLTATSSTYYFFWWRRQREKIVVYYMHTDEVALVEELMPGSEKTDAFAVGHTSRKNIRKMEDRGLALHLLDTNLLVVNTPGNIRTLNYDQKKGEHILKSEESSLHTKRNYRNILPLDSGAKEIMLPGYLIITLDAPLLPAHVEKIMSLGIVITQRVPVNSYILFVEGPEQLTKITDQTNFPFIRAIRPYTAEDTGFIVRKQQFYEGERTGEKNITLDLVLHHKAKTDHVINFLREKDIVIEGIYNNIIRVQFRPRYNAELDLASNKFIQAIYEYVQPVFYNDIARRLVRLDIKDSNTSCLEETGEGEKIAVADTGIDLNHPDLDRENILDVSVGRAGTGDTSDPHGHGTHVTGTIIGNGNASDGKIKGIAPGAKVYFQSLLSDEGGLCKMGMEFPELLQQAYVQGARIHNNSWGAATEARYAFESLALDKFVVDNPEMLVVVAAGNEGASDIEEEEGKGYVGFASVGTPATAKNGITVGACNSQREKGGFAGLAYGDIYKERFPFPPTSDEIISGDPESMAAYSSRGNCDDDRIKPDLVAPGTDILSLRSALAPLSNFHGGYINEAYAFLGGTSMAAPFVSGAAALVRQWLREKRSCANPSAALVKAMLINGTRVLKGNNAIYQSKIIPNANQGFGMLDISGTIPNGHRDFRLGFRDSLDDFHQTGQESVLKLSITQKTWLRVCMAFTDHPDRGCQSDLDLFVDHDRTRKKWIGNEGVNTKRFQRRKQDGTNNVEIVRIEAAEPGLYTIVVKAWSIPPGKKQGFALVVTTGDLAAIFDDSTVSK